MKKFFLFALFFSTLQGGAQPSASLRDLFRQMPDSLMPYLSQNNRLDFIDFVDSNMKAEVKNMLGGTSEMTSLSADSLSIRMSESLQVHLFLLNTASAADSCSQVICLLQTFGTDSISQETTAGFYTVGWERLPKAPLLSPSDQKRIDRLNVQTILKRDDEILKKS